MPCTNMSHPTGLASFEWVFYLGDHVGAEVGQLREAGHVAVWLARARHGLTQSGRIF